MVCLLAWQDQVRQRLHPWTFIAAIHHFDNSKRNARYKPWLPTIPDNANANRIRKTSALNTKQLKQVKPCDSALPASAHATEARGEALVETVTPKKIPEFGQLLTEPGDAVFHPRK